MYYDYDTYEDEAIIESALDIYDEYDVSMEEAIDIAMEAFKNNPLKSVYNKAYNKVFPYTSKKKSGYFDSQRKELDDAANNAANRHDITEGERILLEGLRKAGSVAIDTEEDNLKERERSNIRTGAAAALGAGAAALGAGGVALYKYHKKKLAEAAKAEKEAEELDSRAARKREKAQKAVSQAKEASIYFDYV